MLCDYHANQQLYTCQKYAMLVGTCQPFWLETYDLASFKNSTFIIFFSSNTYELGSWNSCKTKRTTRKTGFDPITCFLGSNSMASDSWGTSRWRLLVCFLLFSRVTTNKRQGERATSKRKLHSTQRLDRINGHRAPVEWPCFQFTTNKHVVLGSCVLKLNPVKLRYFYY